MLESARTTVGPSLALLVNHDDPEREYAYDGEAASIASGGSFIDQCHDLGWVVVASMRGDWKQISANG